MERVASKNCLEPESAVDYSFVDCRIQVGWGTPVIPKIYCGGGGGGLPGGGGGGVG